MSDQMELPMLTLLKTTYDNLKLREQTLIANAYLDALNLGILDEKYSNHPDKLLWEAHHDAKAAVASLTKQGWMKWAITGELVLTDSGRGAYEAWLRDMPNTWTCSR